MSQTYKAVLHGDHVEWLDKPPEKPCQAQVYITFLEETAAEPVGDRGRAMAEALAALATRSTFAGIADPVAWQRETRPNRPLPDREL